MFISRGEPRLELGVHVFGIMWNYFGTSSIVFYLKMKVEEGVHYIRSRFTPRFIYIKRWTISLISLHESRTQLLR